MTDLLEKQCSNNLSEDQKISLIESHFKKIMQILGLDTTDHSLKNTPKRIAKMYVQEIFSSLNENNFPKICFFEDETHTSSSKVILIKNITINSMCEHHFLPMFGRAFIAYIPNKKVIGLSKINRIAAFYSKKPQLQERLTEEIAAKLKEVLCTDDVAVLTDLRHLCVTFRGVNDLPSTTTTYSLHGKFLKQEYKNDFFSQVSIK